MNIFNIFKSKEYKNFNKELNNFRKKYYTSYNKKLYCLKNYLYTDINGDLYLIDLYFNSNYTFPERLEIDIHNLNNKKKIIGHESVYSSYYEGRYKDFIKDGIDMYKKHINKLENDELAFKELKNMNY